MKGVNQTEVVIEEIVIQAINAGCDSVLLGGALLVGSDQQEEITLKEVKSICKSVVQAVKNGAIRQKKINQSVKRVLALKQQCVNSF